VVTFAILATLIFIIVGGFGYLSWMEMSEGGRAASAIVLAESAPKIVIAFAMILFLIFLAIHTTYKAYGDPLKPLAEDARIMALSNPAHRPNISEGPKEVRDLVAGLSVLGEKFETMRVDVEARIDAAASALGEERDTLATLMAKLTQGVVVCNMDGRVLLYNQQARDMLEGTARESGAGDWIGLGRSIHGLLEEGLIRHAQMALIHARQRGEAPQMVPFMASRADSQLLNVHLVPISGKGHQWHGYILTLEDVTERIERETRRALAFRALIEQQRSAVSSIRAAIETILSSPEMTADDRALFHGAIDQEAMKLSKPLDGLEDRIRRDLEDRWPQKVVVGADLVAAIERHVQSLLGVNMAVSVPLEPVRLLADSYAIARCHIFIIGQLRQFSHAEDMALRLETSAGSVSLVLEWTGAPLDMEALRSWGMRNVFTDFQGASMTLFEVIERHSGAIWPQRGETGKRPMLSIVLPMGEAEETAKVGRAEEAGESQAFDFRIGAQGARNGDWTDVALPGVNYTVVDTETTGLHPDKGDEIIAIGAVRIINGRILRREVFDTFVSPRVPISEESFEIHGISEDMVRGQPRIEDVLPALNSFCAETVIVGHNIDFDMRFIANAAEKSGLSFDNPLLDTLRLEYLVNRNQPDNDLSGVAERLGIEAGGRHTALGDALTTAEVFLALLPMLEQAGIKTVGDARQASDATPYAKTSF
jgi:DNA polymerase-3 subunit epsilon